MLATTGGYSSAGAGREEFSSSRATKFQHALMELESNESMKKGI
jgi:hypothetical protein